MTLKRKLRRLANSLDVLTAAITAATTGVPRAPRRLLISFSGGETSAFMAWWLLTNAAEFYDEIKIVFANTSQENEATLIFVDQCDRLLFAPLGYRVTYIEAVQYHGQRKSAGFRIVTFETASRDGSVFEDAIKKYGIPNTKFKGCTRNLKLRPIQSYAKSIGWGTGSYDTAIGIRSDEIDRMSVHAPKHRIVYPLIDLMPMTKPQINTWWRDRPFRLKLKGYQGNCRWCWKKSFRKHFTLIAEEPSMYDFPRRMEEQYGHIGPEFTKHADDLAPGYRRRFFREGKSTDNLFADYEARKDDFVPAEDDAVVWDETLDVGAGCEESCEVFAEEDMAALEEEDDL